MLVCNIENLFFNASSEGIEINNIVAATSDWKCSDLIAEPNVELEDNQEGILFCIRQIKMFQRMHFLQDWPTISGFTQTTCVK